MNILYVSQYFPPEPAAGGVRVSELATLWAGFGHRVRVLTGFPNYPDGIVLPEYRKAWRRGFMRENRHGAQVCRTWLYPAANKGFGGRSLYYASFALSAGLSGLVAAPRHGIVIGSSPPILVGMAACAIAKARRLPFVFEVRDLWPESLEAVQAATPESRTYRTIDRMARFLYRNADHIVVDGRKKRQILVRRGVDGRKISVVRNGVSDEFRSQLQSDTTVAQGKELRQRLGLKDHFLALYFGTFGMAHGLMTLLEAATRLRDEKRISLLLVGDGAERSFLIKEKERRHLGNVRILEKVPRESIPQFLSAADACLIPLRRSEAFKTAIPSKMFEAMAAGKPVILGVEGEAKEILQGSEAGIPVRPEDSAAFARAIRTLASNPAQVREMGEKGLQAVNDRFSRSRLAHEYLRILADVALAPDWAVGLSSVSRRA